MFAGDRSVPHGMAIKGISDPATLEVMACSESMTLIVDLHLQCVVVASDYLRVVDNLQGEYGGSYSMITNEIKAWKTILGSHFQP
jgi:hypothetical protein